MDYVDDIIANNKKLIANNKKLIANNKKLKKENINLRQALLDIIDNYKNDVEQGPF